MKTRIISGIVMGIIVAAILALGFFISPVIVTLGVAALTVGATYEVLHNATKTESKGALITAGIFSALGIIFAAGSGEFTDIFGSNAVMTKISDNWQNTTLALFTLYIVITAIIVLKNHADFSLAQICAFLGMPLALVFVFSSLNFVINGSNGLYYLLLLLNFSCVCDMGAYFTGVTCGKHKLCPAISPKKTVEGAVGGIVSSIVFTVIICLCFKEKLLLPIIFTIPLCILGMIGDLFASAIKRSVNLKDYSNLIPGHGGILDRFDSIIMIAPLMSLFIKFGVL